MVSQNFLEIAGIKIRAESKNKLLEEDEKSYTRFESFFKEIPYEKFDIDLEVEVLNTLPRLRGRGILFEVRRNKRNFDWIISKKDKEFIIESRMGEKYSSFFNEDFTKGKVYIKNSKNSSFWKRSQLIYGPMQVIFINYLAKHKLGVLTHSMGINYKGAGLLFVGPTKSGKSTLARLWNKKEGAVILNDDRIIIRKINNGLYIFGTPWHGDFSDYVDTISRFAPLKKLIFIYHQKENKLLPLNLREAFNKFFPNTFPVFWGKEGMDFTVGFLYEVLNKVPAFSLGFVNDESVVEYLCNL